MTAQDERPELEQLADFFKLSMLRILQIPESHGVAFDDIDLVFIARIPSAENDEGLPRFVFVRSFGGQDEFEEMLEQARRDVSMWDLDPSHIATAFDLSQHSPFEQD